MNFLKKRLKGHKTNKGRDDDDYDDYIPEAPLHPSEIAKLEQRKQEKLANQSGANGAAVAEAQKREDEEKEAKAKEKELVKKGKEEWKFFEQLTQRVNDTVSSSQTALEKFKASTTTDELVKQAALEAGFCEDEPVEERGPTHAKGQWIGFDETFGGNEPVVEESPTEHLDTESSSHEAGEGSVPAKDPQGCDKLDSSFVKSLLDDFGFGEASAPVPSEPCEVPGALLEGDHPDEDDPFDTSFVDVSYVDPASAAEAILQPTLFSGGASKGTDQPPADDPFDTTFVETSSRRASSVVNVENLDLSADPFDCDPREAATRSVLPEEEQRDEEEEPDLSDLYTPAKILRYASRESLASIMSNPFLSETDVYNDFYTPTIGSGACTPFSGAATPSRRNSTNPFDESPEEETANAEAFAIAALTQDFCKAIADEDNSAASDLPLPPPPPPPVPPPPQSEPFDPFATINDDSDSHGNSKRQSLSTDQEATSHPTADDVFASEPSDYQPLNSSSLLVASDVPDYISDVSDAEDIGRPEDVEFNEPATTGRRRSSAFQMELIEKDKEEPPPKFEPLPNLLDRKPSVPVEPCLEYSPEPPEPESDKPFFDPYETVYEPAEKDVSSPITPPPPPDEEESVMTKSGGHKGESLEIGDVGEPNINATGIINDAFEDIVPSDEEDTGRDLEPTSKSETGPSLLDDYGHSNAEAAVVAADDGEDGESFVEDPGLVSAVGDTMTVNEVTTTANQDPFDVFVASDSGVAVGFDDGTDSGKDPFDTSEFSFEPVQDSIPYTDQNTFDAFSAKFEQTSDSGPGSLSLDPFSSPLNKASNKNVAALSESEGFDIFDPFAPAIKPPKNTPIRKPKPLKKETSKDSFDDDDEPDNIRVVIKAKMRDSGDTVTASLGPPPLLPPPPKTPVKSPAERALEEREREREVDEFEALFGTVNAEPPSTLVPPGSDAEWPPALGEAATKHTDSVESPQTPLFDDDTSQPLEDFPAKYEGEGWEMYIRHPAKKKLTGNRYWKKIFIRLSENSVVQLFNKKEDNDPFQELPLQACYSLSEVCAQQYDQYGKIFTLKLQYVFYRERVGVRKGQIARVMTGQITSVGSIAKLGMPLEHAPQVSQLLKLGTQVYDDLKLFAQVIEEALFRMTIHRDRALTYKTEEIQMTMQDELYVEQTKTGVITRQLARVRLFFLAFINGMPGVEVGINDLTRQGKEVVGRHDIIPVVTEEWIRLEACEWHSCVILEEFDKTRIIKLHPPDACYFELMRFRVRPPRNRELPLQINANMIVTKTKVELRCELLVPGCISRKHGQIPCEDIVIRLHIPECWIYFFRTEKHLRYGSAKSSNKRPGKIKGLERFLGAVGAQTLEPTLLETSAGQAKYEHAFHSLVWRIPRLPKEGQGAYTTQLLLLRLPLTSFDQVPESFYEYVHAEFVMPSTTVSHAVVRSISVSSENPPEKYVRYVSRHEYKVGMNVTYQYDENEYVAAASATPEAPSQQAKKQPPPRPEPPAEESNEAKDDSDDSD